MLDRQDIDALLMGALYGELSPAESTRLDEHLSAHPQDRLVLDGLSRARQALKDSLVLTLQAEPPAAVTARLMQEAARRAPAPRAQRAGFFAKLVAMMRHPAFAAAAVIVLVAAIGGTLYKQNGDRASVAEQDVSVETQTPSLARSEAPAAPAVVPEPTFKDEGTVPNEAANEDGFTADLDGKLKLETGENTKPTEPTAPGANEREGDKAEAEKGKKKKVGTRDYVEVRTPDRAPKDLEGTTEDKEVAQSKGDFAKDPADPAAAKTRGKGTTAKTTATVIVPNDSPTSTAGLSMGGDLGKSAGRAAGSGNAAPQAGRTSAQPEPPPTVAGSVADTDDATSSKNEQQDKDPYAVARSQHTKLVALVKANKCADASKLAVQIADKYLDYYKQYIANDRRVKACKPYIENARKKSADKAKRQRNDAQDANEAPAPDSMKATD